MRKGILQLFLALSVGALAVDSAPAADTYAVDGIHSGVTFKIAHLGLSPVYGRFNEFSGTFVLDADAANCSFTLAIKSETVDTNNTKRDEHLRGPDFFNTKQFPAITFKSTTVKASKDGY